MSWIAVVKIIVFKQLVKREVAILVEEKMRLCEKIGSLTESCSLKDHSNELACGITIT